MTEIRSLKTLAMDISTSCNAIRRNWDEMTDLRKSPSLAPSYSGGGGGSNAHREDNSDANDDVSRLDAIISTRMDITDVLGLWARVIIEDLDAQGPYPSGGDAKSLCEFITANAVAMSGHEAAGDMADELARMSQQVERIVNPRAPKGVRLGDCPMETCRGQVFATAGETDAVTGKPVAECSRCTTRASIEWWQSRMNVVSSDALTNSEIIELARRDFGLRLTSRAVEGLVRRGTLTPLEDSRPQQFALAEVIAYLTLRVSNS